MVDVKSAQKKVGIKNNLFQFNKEKKKENNLFQMLFL